MIQDLRWAIRMLLKHPGFSLIAIVELIGHSQYYVGLISRQ